jgi:hypothetical protein
LFRRSQFKSTTRKMDEETKEKMAQAFALAAKRVPKQPKEESNGEMFIRIKEENETKNKRVAARAARKMIKTKKLKKIVHYFKKK